MATRFDRIEATLHDRRPLMPAPVLLSFIAPQKLG
jgi:hypothetical protein